LRRLRTPSRFRHYLPRAALLPLLRRRSPPPPHWLVRNPAAARFGKRSITSRRRITMPTWRSIRIRHRSGLNPDRTRRDQKSIINRRNRMRYPDVIPTQCLVLVRGLVAADRRSRTSDRFGILARPLWPAGLSRLPIGATRRIFGERGSFYPSPRPGGRSFGPNAW